MIKYIFDVDGTITESRQVMDSTFAKLFSKFCNKNEVYLVTGSDRSKTIEQVPAYILDKIKLTFNCSGNEIYKNNTLIHNNTWEPGDELVTELLDILSKSKFPIKTGNHVELRSGTANFSVVGRKATKIDRAAYVTFDKLTNDRLTIVNYLKKHFTELEFVIGGETGIDIYKKGFSKVQCIPFIKNLDTDYLVYFGDQIHENGNDYEIANNCDMFYKVSSYEDTANKLKELINDY